MSGSIVLPSYHLDTNGKPVTVNGKMVTTNSKPVASNGKPVSTNGNPVTANGKPVTTNGKPVTANGNPEQLHVVDIKDEDVTPGMTSHDTLQPTVPVGDNSTVMTFHDIVYTVQARRKCCKSSPKDIIKGVSGVFEPGLNAIMGATGSGKTSLLDIMAARKDPAGLQGRILVNGEKQPDNFKRRTGYVVQDDVVMGTLTVRENIRFSANLRLPSNVTNAEKDRRVTDVINELGLPHVAESKVGTEFIRGISGGERKRTNIAMELIIDPRVLFLDEPTTGLDASTANAVMSLLYQLGLKGRTIIFSLHQPRYSIFSLFRNLVLLSRGHMVYHGHAQEALQYFSTIGYHCEEHNNPADFFLDIINGDSTAVQQPNVTKDTEGTPDDELAKELGSKYKASKWWIEMTDKLDVLSSIGQGGISSEPLPGGRYTTSFFTQFWYLSKRTVLNVVRNPQISVMQIVVMIICGLLIGAIYYQMESDLDGLTNRVGAFFFIVMIQVFGHLTGVELFIKDRKIFVHENSIGFYRVSSYFLAKLLCDVIPMRIIPNIFFFVIVYFMTGLVEGMEQFFTLFLMVTATSLSASSLAFFLSATVSVFSLAQLCIALAYIFMMVFSGVLVKLNTLLDWLAWIKWVSIYRYGLNGILVIELKGHQFCEKNTTTGAIIPPTCVLGDHQLKEMLIPYETDWDLWVNVVALFSMFVGFIMLTYIQLRRVNKYS